MNLIADALCRFKSQILDLPPPLNPLQEPHPVPTVSTQASKPLFFEEIEEDKILAEFLKNNQLGPFFNFLSADLIEIDLNDNENVKNEIQDLLNSRLVFPFEVNVPQKYEITARYRDLILYIKNRYERHSPPIKSIKCRGSKCPKMVGSKVFGDFLTEKLQSLKKVMTSAFGRHIDINFSDIDTHIDAHECMSGLSAMQKSIPEIWLDYLIHAHHCRLGFKITFEDQSREEILSFESLVMSLVSRTKKPIKLEVTGDEIPWMKGKIIEESQFNDLLKAISTPHTKDHDDWLNALACKHLFNKTVEEMKAFITKKGNAFVNFHHEFELNAGVTSKELDRITCCDSKQRVHDIIVDYDTNSVPYRVSFQNMYLELVPQIYGQAKIILKTTVQAILDKACKLIRWENLEKANHKDCTLLWALCIQGYRSVDEKIQQTLLRKFKDFCCLKGKVAETAARVILKEINKRCKDNQPGAVMFAFYACQSMLEEGFPPDEINKIWPLLKVVLLPKDQPSSTLSAQAQIAKSLCESTLDFQTVSNLVQVLGFRRKLLNEAETDKSRFKSVLTTHNRKPALQLTIDGETLIFPLAPENAQKQLQETINKLKSAKNNEALKSIAAISGSLGMPHDVILNIGLNKLPDDSALMLEHPNLLVRKQAYGFLVLDYQRNPSNQSLLNLLRFLPEYLESEPSTLKVLQGILSTGITALKLKGELEFKGALKEYLLKPTPISSDSWRSWCNILATAKDPLLGKLAADLWHRHSQEMSTEQQSAWGLSLVINMASGNFRTAGRLALMLQERSLLSSDDKTKTLQILLEAWTAESLIKPADYEIRIQGIYLMRDLFKLFSTAIKPEDFRQISIAAISAMARSKIPFASFADICLENQVLTETAIKEALELIENSTLDDVRAISIIASLEEAFIQETDSQLSSLYLQLFNLVTEKVREASPDCQQSIEFHCCQLFSRCLMHKPFEESLRILSAFMRKRYIRACPYSAQQLLNCCALMLNQQSSSIQAARMIWEAGIDFKLWASLDIPANHHFLVKFVECLQATQDHACLETARHILSKVGHVASMASDPNVRSSMRKQDKVNLIASIESPTSFRSSRNDIERLVTLTSFDDASDVAESRRAVSTVLSKMMGKEEGSRHTSLALDMLDNPHVRLLFKGHTSEILSLYIKYLEYLLYLKDGKSDERDICGLFKGIVELAARDTELLNKLPAPKLIALLDRFLSGSPRPSISEPLRLELVRHYENLLINLRNSSSFPEICTLCICLAQSRIVRAPSTSVVDSALEAIFTLEKNIHDPISQLLENWTIPNAHLDIAKLKFLKNLIEKLLNSNQFEDAYALIDKFFLSDSSNFSGPDMETLLLEYIGKFSKAARHVFTLKLISKTGNVDPETSLKLFQTLLAIPPASVKPQIQELAIQTYRYFKESGQKGDDTLEKIEAIIALLLNADTVESDSVVELAFELLALVNSNDDSSWMKALKKAAQSKNAKIWRLAWHRSQERPDYKQFISHDTSDPKDCENWSAYEAECLQILMKLFLETKDDSWANVLAEQFQNMLDEKKHLNVLFNSKELLHRRLNKALANLIARIKKTKLSRIPDVLLKPMVKARAAAKETDKGTSAKESLATLDLPLLQFSMETDDIQTFAITAKNLHSFLVTDIGFSKLEQHHFNLLISFAYACVRFYNRENPEPKDHSYHFNIFYVDEASDSVQSNSNVQDSETYLRRLCAKVEEGIPFPPLQLLEALVRHPSRFIIRNVTTITVKHMNQILAQPTGKKAKDDSERIRNYFQALITRMFQADDDEICFKAILMIADDKVKKLFPRENYHRLVTESACSILRFMTSLNKTHPDKFQTAGIAFYNANQQLCNPVSELKPKLMELAFENMGQIFTHPKGMHVGEGKLPWGKKVWDTLRMLEEHRFRSSDLRMPPTPANELQKLSLSKNELSAWTADVKNFIPKIVSPEQILRSVFSQYIHYLLHESELTQEVKPKFLDDYLKSTTADISEHFKNFSISLEGTKEEIFHYNYLLITKWLQLRPTEIWAKFILISYLYLRISLFVRHNYLNKKNVVLELLEKYALNPFSHNDRLLPRLQSQFAGALFKDCVAYGFFKDNPKLRYQLHLILKAKLDDDCDYLDVKGQIEAIDNLTDKLLKVGNVNHQYLASRCLIEAHQNHDEINSMTLATNYQKILADMWAHPYYHALAAKTLQQVASFIRSIPEINNPQKDDEWKKIALKSWTLTLDIARRLYEHLPLESCPYVAAVDLPHLMIDFINLGTMLFCFDGHYMDYITRLRWLIPIAVTKIVPKQNNIKIVQNINRLLTLDSPGNIPKNQEERRMRAVVANEWLKILYDLNDPAGNGAIFTLLNIPPVIELIYKDLDDLEAEAQGYSRPYNPRLVSELTIQEEQNELQESLRMRSAKK